MQIGKPINETKRRPPPRLGGGQDFIHQDEPICDSPVDPAHDVKRRANDREVAAHSLDGRHGNSGPLERRKYAVLAQHVVRAAWYIPKGWATQRKYTAIRIIDPVSQIRMSA